ncbi:MAG: hypothetical protein NVS2B4_06230 [Ramlibacter sp.]
MQRDELQAMLEHAQNCNTRKNLTGALVYVDGCFLQILKGDKGDVRASMDRIATDVRDESVTILQAGEIDSPLFAQWGIACVSATQEQVAAWVGFSAAALPDLFEDIRHDRRKATQVMRRILSVLSGEPVPHTDD